MPATSPTAPTTNTASIICADNMKYRLEDMVQRGHFFAIVDEVDSILIDEARTPLIISGPLDDRSEFYNTIDTFFPQLDKDRLRRRREAAHGDADRNRYGKDRDAAARRRPAQGRFALRRRERLGRASTSIRRCARTRCSPATRTTSSATARWSSSTNSPARMMPGRRYSKACIRRWRRKSISR